MAEDEIFGTSASGGIRGCPPLIMWVGVPQSASARHRCPQCMEWPCPAMVMRSSAANASRHTPSTAIAARTGEGRRW
jgi:hypothetical protein